jgi:hypothetical protein
MPSDASSIDDPMLQKEMWAPGSIEPFREHNDIETLRTHKIETPESENQSESDVKLGDGIATFTDLVKKTRKLSYQIQKSKNSMRSSFMRASDESSKLSSNETPKTTYTKQEGSIITSKEF